MKNYLFILIIFLASCGVSRDSTRHQVILLQRGVLHDDTSFIYSLPFEQGKTHLLIQGYFSHLSHKERVALDFKMKRGTKVCAARGGIVTRIKQDGDRGGWNKKYRPYGNNIVIRHDDGSSAGYWHLRHNGAMVNVGDSVKQGQVIAYSGKTGYAALPHLHFLVWRFDEKGGWHQVPTRFQTSKGVRFLRPFRKYRRPVL